MSVSSASGLVMIGNDSKVWAGYDGKIGFRVWHDRHDMGYGFRHSRHMD